MADTSDDNEALAYFIQRGSLDLDNICTSVYRIGQDSRVQPRSLPNDMLIAELQSVINHLQDTQAVLRAEAADPGVNVVTMLYHDQTDTQ